MGKHFKLTNETKINAFGITLYRIECTLDIKWAKVGDKGGWVETEDNINGNAWVYGDAEVYGNARVYGDAEVYGDADYCCIQSFGSANRTTTAFKCKDGKIIVNCGCFSGNIEDFAKAVERTHGDSKYGREYKAMIELIKVKFGIEDEQH